MKSPFVVLTGSHLTPAQALASELKKHGFIPVDLTMKSPKFNRHRPILSLISMIKLPVYIIKAGWRLWFIRPLAVVSFGGYSALPVCLAAKLIGLPLVIHEQTFAAGLTSRISGWLADRICISWPESFKFFSKNKTVLTGNPIREELLNLKPLAINPPRQKIIYITGGHQGSRAINVAVGSVLPALTAKFKVYHQFGLNQDKDFWPKTRPENYVIKAWFSPQELSNILNRTAMVVSRSGINTVTELAYLQKRAVLIPLETAQKNEQLTNARWLQALGLALILPQAKLTGKTLLAAINQALARKPQNSLIAFDRLRVAKATGNLYRAIAEFL